MSCFEILQLITNILLTLLSLIKAHFVLFAIVGLFCRKRVPKTDKINRYGVVIPARNEEKVIAGLIESIRKNRYPQDRLHIFVIAHNCTDKTAEAARRHGATVYEYNNPEEKTKGYALRHLFDCIERDFGTASFDGFFMLDADNILDARYIARMNDAFEYYHRDSVITSFRNAKNFGANLMSGLYGLYFAIGCRLESCGRTALGCSTRVQGTGFLMSSRVVKNGWPYVTLTEDWEFSVDQILYDNNIRYCDDAIFYDEQPTSVKIMWRQRVRWSRGLLLVFYKRFGEAVAHLFKRKTRHRVSLYDITANIIPYPLALFVLQGLQVILFLAAPLFDSRVTLQSLFLGNSTDLLLSNGILFAWARSSILSYATMLLMGLSVFIADRKRIRGVRFPRKVLITLMWPVFLLIQLPIDVQALFSPRLAWKTIPHSDTTSFDEVNLS